MLTSHPLPYADGPLPLTGHMAYDDDAAAGRRPGVLVAPEAFGLTDHAKGRADRLTAELGYTALAVDLYGRMPADRAEAFALMGELRDPPGKLRQRMRAALAALRAQPTVDPDRIVAIGFCLGGTSCLELARDGADVRAVVSFHGGLTTQAPAAKPARSRPRCSAAPATTTRTSPSTPSAASRPR